MVNQRKSAIIFGASLGGRNFIENQKEYNIIAIADNDVDKIGRSLHGYQIINPDDIFQYTFDYIIITSMYYNPIQKQLLELGCEKEIIIAAPKSYLKTVKPPFEDMKTYEYATSILKEITKLLLDYKIQYFADFGTLLGIVRDGGLISWDDDIDISIRDNQLPDLLSCLNEIIESISTDTVWRYEQVYNKDQTVSHVVLSFDSIEDIKSFTIDIWIIYLQDKLAIQTMNKAPALHFLDYEEIVLGENLIRVPFQYTKYLEHTYGNWEVPKKDTTFADYPFAFSE